ncbi:MAG: hypothetical protein U1E65_23395 [Myxococcota bacterium]
MSLLRLRRAEGLALLGLTACGGSSFDHWPAGKPQISAVDFVSQAPDKPFTLEFLLQIGDSDGDLGLGSLTLDLNGKKTSELPLATVFGAQTPTVALNAAQAQLRVGVDVSTNVKVGDVLNFGFQLTDRVGHTSNRATVQMKAVAPQSKGG